MTDALQVREYEENKKISEYAIGISVRRVQDQRRKSFSENSEQTEDEEETIGIKVIVSAPISRLCG